MKLKTLFMVSSLLGVMGTQTVYASPPPRVNCKKGPIVSYSNCMRPFFVHFLIKKTLPDPDLVSTMERVCRSALDLQDQKKFERLLRPYQDSCNGLPWSADHFIDSLKRELNEGGS